MSVNPHSQPCSFPTARGKCRKPTASTRIIEQFRGSSSSSRPSSELWIRPTDAPDVCKSISVTRSTVAIPQHELSAEN
eukprot:4222081-Pyramimonas_sp.AAC.1